MTNALLICNVSSKVGLGHLSRIITIANRLKKDNLIVPELLIFGEVVKKDELAHFKVYLFSPKDSLETSIEKILKLKKFDILIFDLFYKLYCEVIGNLFNKLKKDFKHIVSIDSFIEHCNLIDLIWIPSFNFNCNKYKPCKSFLKSGWDSFLIQKRLKQKKWKPGKKVLVLTGGSDSTNLGKFLPTRLDESLSNDVNIEWVRGPFSNYPNLPIKSNLNWVVHNSPQHLDEIILQNDYVLTIYGVSFFEVLQYGIPTVVFSPYDGKDKKELRELSKENVALVAYNYESAINNLNTLIKNEELARYYSLNALKKMSINGVETFCKHIYSMINLK